MPLNITTNSAAASQLLSREKPKCLAKEYDSLGQRKKDHRTYDDQGVCPYP